MSDRTLCSRCTYDAIATEASARGERVTLLKDQRDGFRHGVALYAHAIGTTARRGRRVAWFAELPKECRC